jgi:hypothetical protein
MAPSGLKQACLSTINTVVPGIARWQAFAVQMAASGKEQRGVSVISIAALAPRTCGKIEALRKKTLTSPTTPC